MAHDPEEAPCALYLEALCPPRERLPQGKLAIERMKGHADCLIYTLFVRPWKAQCQLLEIGIPCSLLLPTCAPFFAISGLALTLQVSAPKMAQALQISLAEGVAGAFLS